MYLTVAGLLGILVVVVWGVFKRYLFNDPQPYVEQVALLLVIDVAMFGASAMVRDEGHIGMESLVALLPEKAQFVVGFIVGIMTILFGVPTMMDMMHRSERFARASLASVRYAIVGGEPMTPHLAQEVGADGYAPSAREAVALAWRLTQP